MDPEEGRGGGRILARSGVVGGWEEGGGSGVCGWGIGTVGGGGAEAK